MNGLCNRLGWTYVGFPGPVEVCVAACGRIKDFLVVLDR